MALPEPAPGLVIFVWPGYDLRPITRDKPDVFAWRFLPVEIFVALKRGI